MLHLPKDLILASASPRRIQLLRQVGLEFRAISASIQEEYNGRKPVEFAVDMAVEKASSVAASLEQAIVLAADTIVVLGDKILGKPSDAKEAKEMLHSLSNRLHEVITGYCIYDRPSNNVIKNYELTKVWFRELENEEIESYVNSGSPLDKAGAYGIQDDFGAVFVSRIEGCYYNVVGLPLAKVYNDLKHCIANNVM